MNNLVFTLILALTQWVVYLITGRNRRQIRKIPKGMEILCQPPGKRYMLYALGVVVFGFVLFFFVLYIMDGAPEDARFIWGVCVAVAVLTLFITIWGGNMLARECVYFDGEKIQIERAFQKPKTFRWNEIRKIDGSFDNTINLYLADGTKIFTASTAMVNYELFCAVLKKKCPAGVTGYYQSLTYENPKKCILRYGLDYYVLAIMGIFILLMYFAILLSADDRNVLQKILHSDSSEWFSIWFAPVCGVVSVIFLFLFHNTNIKYSPEKIILKYPLQRKREFYWRDMKRVELIPADKKEEGNWKKLRIYTAEGVYNINLQVLTYGRDAFLTEFFKMVERYNIPCE